MSGGAPRAGAHPALNFVYANDVVKTALNGRVHVASGAWDRVMFAVTPCVPPLENGIALAPPESTSSRETRMKPLGILGVILVIAGIVVLALQGFSYTKDRDTVSVGPLSVSAEEKGFVSPAVGAVAVVAGLVLVAVGRRRA